MSRLNTMIIHSHVHACCLFNPLLVYVYEVDAFFILFMIWLALLPCLSCCLVLRCMIRFHMLGFLIRVWLFIALWIDMCHGMNDAMLYVRCMLVCVWVRIQVLILFLMRLRHKTQRWEAKVGWSWVPNAFPRMYLNSKPILW